MVKEKERVLGKAVSAKALECWVELTQELVAAIVMLRVDVGVKVVGIEKRTNAIELVICVVNLTREQC